MSDVRSKNPYELLGNDSEQDSDREPQPPTKVADKSAPRTGKRNASDITPPPARGAAVTGGERGRGGRRGGRGGYGGGSEDAFRDRAAGSAINRGKPTDDGFHQDRGARGRGRGGGGRGGRGREGDRQDRTGRGEHQKQTDLSWGAPTGDSEWTDEKAGEAIAKAEENEVSLENAAAPAAGDNAAAAGDRETNLQPAEPEPEQEPEDNSKSFAEYQAEQAAAKLEELGLQEARKPNEGSKPDKKWAKARELKREDEEAEYIHGESGKARRERERKTKELIDIDYGFQEPSRGRGDGRGRGRGDRGGRGGGRGRGEGGFRGRGDGGYRGGRGDGGFRGGPRGGRGGDIYIGVNSEENFPSLGGPK